MISLSVSDLKPALAGLSKVVSGKSSLEPLRCVRVDATPERVSIMGTDLEMYARVELPEASCDVAESFLLPLDRLQAVARRFHGRTVLNIEPGKISCDLGTGRVSENIEAPKVEEFPEEPEFEINTVALPESFSRRFTEAMGCSSTDATRFILNGVQLDVSDPSGHYMVATDGRHLFSANSFALPISDSVRQMVVMPLRVADVAPAEEPTDKQEVSAGPATEPTTAPEEQEATPAPPEPQPERKTMTETIGHRTNGAATMPYLNGAPRSTTPGIPAADKPAIEAA
ncbi:MAG: hypothetical protein WCS65_16500, partial [Verrucomicrobiae bacterium]